MKSNNKSIIILQNAPYLVSATIPLKKEQIAHLKPVHLKNYNTTPYVKNDFYALCRCEMYGKGFDDPENKCETIKGGSTCFNKL